MEILESQGNGEGSQADREERKEILETDARDDDEEERD